ncbi:zf-TFIIB domain-containing protein [Kineosporiaceae bacterium SCSIO 59966]|nr:zf-TFIIB domain-containing protein [Kineosporiaceae bacterium SCSIO 59966]
MTETQQTLTCPKCGADMRAYERNGITIDQCTACRGIFLDRGELERLVDAESAFYGRPGPQQPPAYGDDRGHHGGYGSGHGGHGQGQRRRGFLGDLFG